MRGLPLTVVPLSLCITCQYVCVQESHAGHLSVSSNQPRMCRKHNRFLTIKTQKTCIANKSICVCLFQLKR